MFKLSFFWGAKRENNSMKQTTEELSVVEKQSGNKCLHYQFYMRYNPKFEFYFLLSLLSCTRTKIL